MSHIILLPCGKAIWLISPSSYLGNKSNQEIYLVYNRPITSILSLLAAHLHAIKFSLLILNTLHT